MPMQSAHMIACMVRCCAPIADGCICTVHSRLCAFAALLLACTDMQPSLASTGMQLTHTHPPASTASHATHARRQRLPEPHLRQCDSCQDVYCSTCSTCNYDTRDTRVFCLDCNQGCCGMGERSEPSASGCHAACSPYLSPAPWHSNGGAFGMRSPWQAGTPGGHLGTPLPMPLGQLGF